MLSTHVTLAFLLFVSQIACKAIINTPHGLHSRVRERDESLRRTALSALDDTLSKRDRISSGIVESRQAIGGGGTSGSDINTAINQACTSAISGIHDFNSDSGLGGCYNIMSLNRTTGYFQADLRLYKVLEPSGSFAGIPIDDMLVNLNSDFAEFAQLSLTSKSKRAEIDARQGNDNSSNYSEVLEGLWEGRIEQLDYSKLSDSDFMALMIPQFDIRAIQPHTQIPVNSLLNTSSAVYFVTGDIVARSEQQAIIATEAGSALAAQEKAKIFVLPGTTLGIFPVGLIVTGSWAVLFILTFSLGTIGRIRYRSLYRSRLVALGRLRSL